MQNTCDSNLGLTRFTTLRVGSMGETSKKENGAEGSIPQKSPKLLKVWTLHIAESIKHSQSMKEEVGDTNFRIHVRRWFDDD